MDATCYLTLFTETQHSVYRAFLTPSVFVEDANTSRTLYKGIPTPLQRIPTPRTSKLAKKIPTLRSKCSATDTYLASMTPRHKSPRTSSALQTLVTWVFLHRQVLTKSKAMPFTEGQIIADRYCNHAQISFYPIPSPYRWDPIWLSKVFCESVITKKYNPLLDSHT
jgi:hypothetical protein